MFILPNHKKTDTQTIDYARPFTKKHTIKRSSLETLWSFITCGLALVCLVIIAFFTTPGKKILTPLISPLQELHSLAEAKNQQHEVFGFAPYWTFDKLDNVDFSVLTTFAYFGVPIDGAGNVVQDDPGYATFKSDQATQIFDKAHRYGTRVVLTITQMDNSTIEAFLYSPDAQQNAINQVVDEIKNRGIDGVNVDFEYLGNPGIDLRNRFTQFVTNLANKTHAEVKNSKVSVSVYALSAHDPNIYDIANLSKNTDTIFMMAYDFAVAGSDNASPTAPLYGHSTGKYSYDVATAVDDFLKVMPSNKLVLGVPYYGYNYLVYEPKVNAETKPYYSWQGTPTAQTYEFAKDNVKAQVSGWDDDGKVGWKAYYDAENGTWRMIFLDDQKSLGIKYDYAKSKNLEGVGIWALGFDNGESELWTVLKDKFGTKIADGRTSRLAENQ